MVLVTHWHTEANNIIRSSLCLPPISPSLPSSLPILLFFLIINIYILSLLSQIARTDNETNPTHPSPLSSLEPTHSWELGRESRASVAEQPVKAALSSQTHAKYRPTCPSLLFLAINLSPWDLQIFFSYLQSADNLPGPRISVLGGKELVSSVFLKASLNSECGWKVSG